MKTLEKLSIIFFLVVLSFGCWPTSEVDPTKASCEVDTCDYKYYPAAYCITIPDKVKWQPEQSTTGWRCATDKCRIVSQGNYYWKESDIVSICNKNGFFEVDVTTLTNGGNITSDSVGASICYRQTINIKGPVDWFANGKPQQEALMLTLLNDIYEDLSNCRYYTNDAN